MPESSCGVVGFVDEIGRPFHYALFLGKAPEDDRLQLCAREHCE